MSEFENINIEITDEIENALDVVQSVNSKVIDSYETQLEGFKNSLILALEVIDKLLKHVDVTETEFIEFLKNSLMQIKLNIEPKELPIEPVQVDTPEISVQDEEGLLEMKQEEEQSDDNEVESDENTEEEMELSENKWIKYLLNM